VAWVLGLITFPYVAVPAYWVFGRSKFRGFVALRRADLVKTVPAARRYLDELKTGQLIAFPERQRELSIEKLAKLPFTVGNDVELLVDGKDTFDSIFEGIQRAEDYILVQFYILRADGLGSQLKDRLAAKARQGVQVRVLYDEVGSHDLPDAYLSDMALPMASRPTNSTPPRGAPIVSRSIFATIARSSWSTDGKPGSAVTMSATSIWDKTPSPVRGATPIYGFAGRWCKRSS
jgi:phosphatidylserine/phosphatidylglycerophosphate/cardiolipin synthase-like enzyme